MPPAATRPADRVVFEALPGHGFRLIDVPAIEHDRLPEAALDAIEIGKTELVPLRDDDERVRALESLVRLAGELDAVAEHTTGVLDGLGIEGPNRGPTLQELAPALGTDAESLESLDRLSREAISLESSVAGTEKRLEDFVADSTASVPDGGIDSDRMRSGVGALIGCLTPREQLILRLRYGLGGEEEHTLEQIGQSLGLSRERVRQLEARALKKLRETAPAQNLHPILEP